MALTPGLELRPTQTLMVTPRLQQAIKLLQFSHVELSAYLERELECNPLLERVDAGTSAISSDAESDFAAARLHTIDRSPLARDDDEAGAGVIERRATNALTLTDHLIGQLNIAVTDPADRRVGRGLIDLLDEAGYLGDDLDSAAEMLGCDRDRAEALLKLIQTFDPAGVGARDLAECLALQLRERDRLDPAMTAFLDNLDMVAKGDFGGLCRACSVDEDDACDMIAELRALDPKPGLAFGSDTAPSIIPDLFVHPGRDGGWQVELNGEALPHLLVNRAYHAHIAGRGRDRTAKSFIAERFDTANWLVRSLDRRARTILEVATEVVARQDAFFRYGVAFLKPLTLREVAQEIGMHESTVSRATANKYLATPHGVHAMKYFFTAPVASLAGGEAHSAEAVRHRIGDLIDGETPQSILSDERIVRSLRAQGVDIARRTVAKYREAMRIPSSAVRRRQKRGSAGVVRIASNAISR